MMEDSDLDEIRAQRLAQLQSQYGSGPAGQPGNPNQQKVAEERKREVDDMKNSILSQVLDQSARARLNTLMLGKPEKGRMVENMILQMAQSGQLRSKLGEEELIGLLERVGSQKSTTVKFDRRRAALDSDDDDL
ncbi:programmed cell death protein 5 [Frankliniella occidentalis]|uniref:Programmed cell death protein 5 n=1 Tax=Frankliniella occidentalis TaxID=133901 RepID=A0A6J1RUI9_FRAOC|nr:programmed cell death protein 5 [Frankliniella occidentalis]